MKKVIVWMPDNRKVIIKNATVFPDPQFLIVTGDDGKYKFPWSNVCGVWEGKDS